MTARKAKRKYVKARLKPQVRIVRLRVAPQLTPGEVRQLQARAAADMRSLGGYVAWLLIKDLRRESGRKRRSTGVSPSDKRSAYEIAVPLTAEQKGKVEDRARDEVRSVSSLVALLIVAELRRG